MSPGYGGRAGFFGGGILTLTSGVPDTSFLTRDIDVNVGVTCTDAPLSSHADLDIPTQDIDFRFLCVVTGDLTEDILCIKLFRHAAALNAPTDKYAFSTSALHAHTSIA